MAAGWVAGGWVAEDLEAEGWAAVGWVMGEGGWVTGEGGSEAQARVAAGWAAGGLVGAVAKGLRQAPGQGKELFKPCGFHMNGLSLQTFAWQHASGACFRP